jgi:hypothetical protein
MTAPQNEYVKAITTLQSQVIQLQEELHEQRKMIVKPAQPPVITTIPVKPSKPVPFAGKKGESVEAWVFQIEQYFRLCQLKDETTRAAYAVSYLKDNAALWWRSVSNGAGDATKEWRALKTELIAQFKPTNANKLARDRLANLKQTTSVQAYSFAFRAIVLEINDISNSEKLDRFIRGLKDKVRQEVELRDPTTLEEATRIAERYDTIAFNYRPRFERNERNNGVIPMEIDSIQRRNLSNEEKERCFKEGRCFECQGGGHIARFCPNKKRRTNGVNAIEEMEGKE